MMKQNQYQTYEDSDISSSVSAAIPIDVVVILVAAVPFKEAEPNMRIKISSSNMRKDEDIF
ncbi:MAG: hypothetical protein M3044_18470 [Thermoproteota archaeon]|nr:hypothetical protein [Thermoproteota archaeon]